MLHEHADEKRVARLETRLRMDGYLKNPPIVAPIPGTGRYVVLDGANRTSAIQRIGCPHHLVQVVDYNSQVELLTWHHLITGREPATFLQEIAAIDGILVKPASLQAARSALADRSILAYLAIPFSEGETPAQVYTAECESGGGNGDPQGSTAMLNAMVNTYKGDPKVAIHRVSTDQLQELMAYYDDISGLVVFPAYTREDILRLAQAGTRVPAGITRHIISRRALRVNVPLDLLCSDAPLEEKNAWWHDQIKRKLAANEIRLYQESTYLFDE